VQLDSDWAALKDQRSIRTAQRIADAVCVRERSSTGARLEFDLVLDEQLGVALRWREARRRILISLRGTVARRWVEDTLTLEVESPDALPLDEVITRSTHALLLPALRPLTPRLVLDALPISTQERLRWTKDGRLAHSGAVTIRRGQPVSVTTYAVETIAALAADPAIISQWRAEDVMMLQATG
jgi:hypothetical protein